MRVIAIFKRVLREMIRDKRTLALMFLAPLFILTLMFFLFNTSSDTVAKIGVSRVDTTVVKAIKNKHVKITHYSANATAKG